MYNLKEETNSKRVKMLYI